MAKRWLIGGLAVGVGALVVAPETRTWLRRRLGLEAEDRRWFEEESAESAEYEGDEPLDTREARFSLRARLSEDAPAEPEAAFTPGPAEVAEPEPEPLAAEAAPEPAAFAAEPPPQPDPDPFAAQPQPEPDPFAAPPTPEPAPFGAMPAPEPDADPVEAPADVEPPAAESEPEPEPEAAPWPGSEPARSVEPESTPFSPPARDVGYGPAPYESVPAVNPEVDAPKSPGEDTDEVGPLPPLNAWEPTVAPPLPPPSSAGSGAGHPSTPPSELRPPAPPPSRPFSSRPFSGEGPSFRSAIDAARERVHGAAREATPEEGEDSEPSDEN